MKYLISTLIISLTFSLVLSAQTKDIVENYGIEYPLHMQNIGKIVFMNQYIGIADFEAKDFQSSFVLQEKSNLSMRAFMGNSLTNALHNLAPELSIEELHASGNYQFRFVVDEQLVYTENLHIGAGTKETKNNHTMLYIPLAGGKKMESWGQFMWMRFMSNGGADAFTAGKHQLRIEMRPYVQLEELLIGELIATGEITVEVMERPVAEKYLTIQPIAEKSGLPISTANYDKQLIRELNRKIANASLRDITSIVVIKDGELLLEEYFNGAKRKTLHDTRSVGKSIISTLLGMTIADGFIQNEKATLDEFYTLEKFNNYSERKDKISLENLLTMSSGLGGSDFDEESTSREDLMQENKDWLQFALDLPMHENKEIGKNWDYFSGGMMILADVMDQNIPIGLESYAEEKLFRPLGINKYKWQYTPLKTINACGGLRLRSLDLARFGQLYSNQGQRNDKRILASSWVTKSFAKHHEVPMAKDNFYGYLFWSKTYEVNGEAHEVYYASGNGGNRIFIFKDQPLVIVITATAYNTPYGRAQADKIMQDFLIPALMEKRVTLN